MAVNYLLPPLSPREYDPYTVYDDGLAISFDTKRAAERYKREHNLV